MISAAKEITKLSQYKVLKLTNMRHLFIFMLSVFCGFYGFSQRSIKKSKSFNSPHFVKWNKPPIDSTAIYNWPSLGYNLAISNNGKYFMYDISNTPIGRNTLVVKSTINLWKKEFFDVSQGFFSSDSKQFVFLRKDTLFFLQLGTNNYKFISNVSNYLVPNAGKREYFAYKLNNSNDELVVHNLLTNKNKSYLFVRDFSFNELGTILLFTSIDKNVKKNENLSLQLINFAEDLTPCKIWSNDSIGKMNTSINGFASDSYGTQVTFIVKEIIGKQILNYIWYYNVLDKRKSIKVTYQSPGIEPGFTISDIIPSFSKDGRYLFFKIQLPPENHMPKSDVISLDIWSYHDTILQATQMYMMKEPQLYEAVVATGESNKVICLENKYDKIKAYPQKGDFVVVNSNKSGDRFWMNDYSDSSVNINWLVSLKDGSRKRIQTDGYAQFYFSPAGEYLVYYDSKTEHNYYSYNLTSGKTVNISSGIPNGWLAYKDEYYKGNPTTTEPTVPVGFAGWLEHDSAILVYDHYDIWRLGLNGQSLPTCITEGYGRLNNTKLRLTYGHDEAVFCNKESLLLTAFNTIIKTNGFYRKKVDENGNPELLIMGPWTLSHIGSNLLPVSSGYFDNGMIPLKAGESNVWILKSQTATDAPNYCLTKDFKHYKFLTDLQPQKKHNWLTAELINFEQLDGTTSQGVLYKPENFDSLKKYPVLFNYYAQRSHRLYEYPTPYFTRNNINVAWFVSNGYLVFTPDIHFIHGRPGKSTYNTVVSAAKWLSKMPFVDSKRMGINGHSVGGFETNYLITHTNLFAAALSGAGTSDVVSSSLQLWGTEGKNRGSRLSGYETSIGYSLWERPDLYLENSPILSADKVTTPLIIFHSKDDTAVPWEQALEFFIALRRLGKKVWILQYDGQNHSNSDKSAEDFTTRITQFFDHYLKDAPAPKWMTRGIRAADKGIDNGLELDPEIKTPVQGLLTPEEKKKMEALKHRKPISVTFE